MRAYIIYGWFYPDYHPHSSSGIFCWLSVLCSLEYPKFLENSWVGGMSWSGWGMWGSQRAGRLPASWQKREPVRGATSWPRATPKRKHRRPWQVGESSSGTMSVVLSMVLPVIFSAVLMAKIEFFLKNLHSHIFGPNILHSAGLLIESFFFHSSVNAAISEFGSFFVNIEIHV